MIGSSRSYAIGMAHFQIGGGFRTLVILCAAYLAIVGAVIGWLSYEAAARGGGPVITSDAVTLILLLETLMLVFFGSFRIAGAIRTDIASKMMESHRLMPIPSWRAVVGYMFGSTSHVIGFALLNVLLAYVFAGLSGTSLARVTMSQAVLGLFVVLTWSASALGAFRGKMYGVIVGITISGGFMGGIYLYGLLPGLALLVGPMMGPTIYNLGATSTVAQWAYPASFAAQGIFFAFFFAGACRAYRGTYATTFSLAQVLMLMLAWTMTSIAGIRLWEEFHFSISLFSRASDFALTPQLQTIASVVAAMLIALVPLRTLTIVERNWKRNWKRGWIGSAATLLALAVMISMIPLAIVKMPEATAARFGMTFLIVASHLACVYLLFRVMRRAKAIQTFIALAVPGFALWIGPLIIELICMWMNSDAYHEPAPAQWAISALSPPALLGFIWTPGSQVSPVGGLAWLSLLPLLLAALVLPRWGKKKAAAVIVEENAGALRLAPAIQPRVIEPATVMADRPESGSS